MDPYDFITPELTPEEERRQFERLISDESDPPSQVLTRRTVEPFKFRYGMPAFLFVILLGLGYFSELFGVRAHAESSTFLVIVSMSAVVLAAIVFWFIVECVKDECAREFACENGVHAWQA